MVSPRGIIHREVYRAGSGDDGAGTAACIGLRPGTKEVEARTGGRHGNRAVVGDRGANNQPNERLPC